MRTVRFVAGTIFVMGAASLGWMQAAPQTAPSPWYLERGTATRPLPEDPLLATATALAGLLRDGSVPGFYDGQFAVTRHRFQELAAIALDPDLNHVLRMMAIMALQEAGDGAQLLGVLEQLLVPPEYEFTQDNAAWRNLWRADDPVAVRDQQVVARSQAARFALAKDGQPAQVLAKIDVMRQFVRSRLADALDPSYPSRDGRVDFARHLVFEIAYHYQQFDDYEHAAEWFSMLTDNLPGLAETTMAHYNLACIAALQAQPDKAIQHLQAAHAVGFSDVNWMLEDGDLVSLRNRQDFRDLVASMRNERPLEQP